MATLKVKKSDGTWVGVLTEGGVLYYPQDLTAEQKQTARDNIGAIAAGEGGNASLENASPNSLVETDANGNLVTNRKLVVGASAPSEVQDLQTGDIYLWNGETAPDEITPDNIGAARLDGDGRLDPTQACAAVKMIKVDTSGLTNYTLTNADKGKLLFFTDVAADLNFPINISKDNFEVGDEIEILCFDGNLKISLVSDSSTGLATYSGAGLGRTVSLQGTYGLLAIKKFTSNYFYVTGDVQ